MPPVLAAGIGAVATIGGGLLSASAQKKAGKDAAAATERASEREIQFARDTYNQNAARLDPYNQSGQYAMGVLNGLLYGDAAPNIAASPVTTGGALAMAEEPEFQMPGGFSNIAYGMAIDQIKSGKITSADQINQPALKDYFNKWTAWKNAKTTPGVTTGGVTGAQARNAFDTFRNSTNYQFQLSEGLKGVQTGMGALGAFDSGATRKALNDYAGNMALGSLGSYMSQLQAMMGSGLSASGALAGVSTNTMNAVNASTRAAGEAQANAALIRGNATANMYGNIAGALGGLASSFSGGRI